MTDFEKLLLKYGLVQFGRFTAPNDEVLPFKLNLNLLTSYPDALGLAADAMIEGVQMHHIQVERLLCPFDSVPLATLVSYKTGIPLVYSRGRGEAPVRDFVGAYDLDHPTLFITNGYVPWEDHTALLQSAARVGLRTIDSYTLVDCGNSTEYGVGLIHWLGLFRVDVLAHEAEAQGLIPPRVVELVTDWLQQSQ